ncbi:MAG: hypothetical protein COZ23_03960 [Hydrogenophilales bacterium CG_4_10_14_3_um_filter_58_23]|nr:MAG: hypothetical protein COW70_06490 [Hydrogenophilales bacterium CG18_big_fil_WC_8_21_14_2_50_58_12]PIY01271.1 MAG: hypothetical protein COZ23_03960 [Hydrogenophilales bacterium CG_4_10_14_3_um_filter_58_23]
MSYKAGSTKFTGLLFCALLFLSQPTIATEFWDIPPLPPADEYGNILINRTSNSKGIKPATFSHWIHRRKFTCRVCHFELEFNMKANTTEITEAANREGKYCGTSGCHDGKASFGHKKPDCEKCHNGDKSYKKERFSELSRLPAARFGNKIDWGKALNKGLTTPAKYLSIKPDADISFKETLVLESEWEGTPPAIFPHRPHTWLLDCSNCHPDIFNIKKKTTKHFSMIANLGGEFCGVCHSKVAFPMNDCKRCHPAMSD